MARWRRRRPPPRATVSLTLDDGVASQRAAAELVDARGLKATFYVPTGLVGTAGRLDWAEVEQLAAAGHEIGGHTRSHVRLPELTDEEAEKEIGADRRALLERGLEARTFAYPFGEHDLRARSLVKSAGYEAARAVGGILETIPPEELYALRTPHSARGRTDAD